MNRYYVIDDIGKVVQKGLTIAEALVLCYLHKEYSVCEWVKGNLKVMSPEKIKAA